MQSRGHAAIVHSLPPQWRSHSQTATLVSVLPVFSVVIRQTPRSLQLVLHTASEQLGPAHPAKHSHFPLARHRPRSEQRAGHVTPEQSSPRRPGAHRHWPSTQRPCGGWQSAAHVRSHIRPIDDGAYPASHRHEPPTHIPCSPQPPPLVGVANAYSEAWWASPRLWASSSSAAERPPAERPPAGMHDRWSQRSPRHPGSQTHAPATQAPWTQPSPQPPSSGAQSGRWSKPGSHAHTPVLPSQTPWPEQPRGQRRSSQFSPPNPGSHAQRSGVWCAP